MAFKATPTQVLSKTLPLCDARRGEFVLQAASLSQGELQEGYGTNSREAAA